MKVGYDLNLTPWKFKFTSLMKIEFKYFFEKLNYQTKFLAIIMQKSHWLMIEFSWGVVYYAFTG